MRILIGVLYELATFYGNDPFSLACHRGASEFARLGINKDGKWINRRLKTFTQEGILTCVDSGKGGILNERRAAQFRWTWTMKEPPSNDINALLNEL